MSKSLMRPADDGILGSSVCEEHSLYMCNKCLRKEVERLRLDLAAANLTLATVGNIIGGPIGAFTEYEGGFRERGERIQRAVKLIATALGGPGVDIRERLADLCHQQWSGWMVYLFSKAEENSMFVRSAVIPGSFADRWRRQMITPYKDLSGPEQDSDRAEADKFIALLEQL